MHREFSNQQKLLKIVFVFSTASGLASNSYGDLHLFSINIFKKVNVTFGPLAYKNQFELAIKNNLFLLRALLRFVFDLTTKGI